MKHLPILAFAFAAATSLTTPLLAAEAETKAAPAPVPLSPEILPGPGLEYHDFVYAGEWDTRKPEAQSLFVVRKGKIVWSTTIPLRTPSGGAQEFDDATLLPDGNILYAKMSGAGLMTPDKRLLWDFQCPPKTECHSVQPIGKNLVLIALNGTPPLALIIDTSTGKTVKEIHIPTTNKNSHGQYRHIRMTKKHTLLVPLLGDGRVVEYDISGTEVRELWSVPAKSPWSAERLKNGNTLIAGDWSGYVREVNPAGETVWEFTQADVPNIRLFNTQTARRLANGNTIICSWVGGHKAMEDWPKSVQMLEVTKDKKVVWAVRSWKDPVDLGPSTHVQMLDVEDAAETVDDYTL